MAEISFITRPYTDASEASNTVWVENMLKAGVSIRGLYFLCVETETPRHAMEIIEGAELKKDIYKNKRYRVIGIADGRAAAFELVRQVVVDFLAAGHSFDEFRDYLQGLR